MNRKFFAAALALLAAGVSQPETAAAHEEQPLTQGQTVYASVYSNIFVGGKAWPLNLSSILSIRNTDMKNPVTVTAIDYYDTDGKLLRRYQTVPSVLAPLATKYLHMNEKDTQGGPGANFIVRWQSAKPVNPPIVETLMLGAREGVSFIVRGQVIRE